MALRSLVPLLALLLLGPGSAGSLPAQDRPLTPAQQRGVDRDLTRYQKGDEKVRDAVIRKLILAGEPTRQYLQNRSKEDLLQVEVQDILREMDHLEGRDLLAKEMSVPPSEWSAWTFQAGEVIVLHQGGRWAGLRVDPVVDPKNGRITVHVAETDDPLLPLGGPGVDRRSVEVVGAEVPMRQVRAYPDRDYSLEVLGSPIGLRGTGAEAFRYRHRDGAPSVARSGARSWRKLKGGDPDLLYRDRTDPEYGNISRRVQQFLFRIIEGVEPLPTYGTPDEADYAYAEHVQVEFREEADGEPTLLVAFPHATEVPYDPETHTRLARFAARARGTAEPPRLLVWVGAAGAHEANLFWTGKDFVRPKGKLLKRIRALFPEDY